MGSLPSGLEFGAWLLIWGLIYRMAEIWLRDTAIGRALAAIY